MVSKNGEGPPKSEGHTLTTTNDMMIYWGGYPMREDMGYKYNFRTEKWEKISPKNGTKFYCIEMHTAHWFPKEAKIMFLTGWYEQGKIDWVVSLKMGVEFMLFYYNKSNHSFFPSSFQEFSRFLFLCHKYSHPHSLSRIPKVLLFVILNFCI